MLFTLSTISGLLMASLALGAPMASLDADTFLQNGKDAQVLNAEFAKLNTSDSCNAGEVACLGASVAQCVNGTWQAEACPKSLFCFALPSVREEGTVISCTSNTTALSVISASGATGGIAANSTDDSVGFPTDCGDDDDEDGDDAGSSNSTVTATGTRVHTTASQTPSVSASFSASSADATATAAVSSTGTDDATEPTVTVTVTLPPASFSTQFSETTTVDPAQASSFLSSIATDPNFSIVTTIISTSTPASTPAGVSSAVSSEKAQTSAFSSKPVGIASSPSFTSDIGAPTTITLLSRPTSAGTSASSQATSAQAAAADDGSSY
ncbi:hypothetical protein PYCCODRAFT_1410758 [Trametes coccinea BRFM310]|uniref:Carbohydrate-binding module family 19 domain-containing protein n=1 Tax=Trametes coccinea (strain BRFM310) TaxID=1353009 RepID=A0A1Y2INM7_TRAC3|nr:hypothetical protein PYCCODRAFT_1410758 [Trametes coccinea BRFM310]